MGRVTQTVAAQDATQAATLESMVIAASSAPITQMQTAKTSSAGSAAHSPTEFEVDADHLLKSAVESRRIPEPESLRTRGLSLVRTITKSRERKCEERKGMKQEKDAKRWKH